MNPWIVAGIILGVILVLVILTKGKILKAFFDLLELIFELFGALLKLD